MEMDSLHPEMGLPISVLMCDFVYSGPIETYSPDIKENAS